MHLLNVLAALAAIPAAAIGYILMRHFLATKDPRDRW